MPFSAKATRRRERGTRSNCSRFRRFAARLSQEAFTDGPILLKDHAAEYLFHRHSATARLRTP